MSRLAAVARDICELARALSYETDPRRLSLGVARASRELTQADDARCVLHDPAKGSLSAWAPRSPDPWVGSAAEGIAGWVTRTGSAVRSDRAGDDPRFQAAVDDPSGDGDRRILAVPIGLPLLTPESASGTGQGTVAVFAVLVVTRSASAPPFTQLEQQRLELLADQLAPAFDRLGGPLDDASGNDDRDSTGPFTADALRRYAGAGDDLGQPVEVSPRWTRWVFPLMVLALVAGSVYAAAFSIGEYAKGVAVIQRQGAGASLVAAFPARYRSQLAPGMRLHLDIDGYDPGTELPTIASVGDVVDAAEASRVLGIAGATPRPQPSLTGPVVVVRSPLPAAAATREDGHDRYLGLRGTAEVKVGSERLLFSLLPRLRVFGEGADG
jgi:hypothetical protein